MAALRDGFLLIWLMACVPAPAPAPAPKVHHARVSVSAREDPVWVDPDDALFAAPLAGEIGLPYDCRGVRPGPGWASPTTHATARLVAVVDPDSPERVEETPELLEALSDASNQDPTALTIFERVVVQSTALSLALRAHDELAERAWSVVERFAATPQELEALGSVADVSVEGWLGPRRSWHDRKGEQCGDGRLLLHDRFFAGARAFRPIRTGAWRALVAQLVAIDTQGGAHVTPFVGQIELRRGLDPEAPVCIVHLDEEALRGGAPGGLRRAQLDRLAPTRLVQHASPGAIACMNCHGGHGIGDFDDVPEEEAASLRMNRQSALVELIEMRVNSIR